LPTSARSSDFILSRFIGSRRSLTVSSHTLNNVPFRATSWSAGNIQSTSKIHPKMAYTPPKSLGDLPLELVERIIDVLDARETPSTRSLRQQSSSAITHTDIPPLKCLSRTCHSLRGLIMDRLFQTAVLNVDVQLNRKMRLHWNSELSVFQDFLARHKLSRHLRSLVVQFIVQTPICRKVDLKGFAGHICSMIMHLHKPETLTVIIPPPLMPYLVPHGYPGPAHDEAWISNAPPHVLTCTRSAESPIMQTDVNLHPHLGLWKHCYSSITLSEASTRIYGPNQYYRKNQPSLFGSRQFQLLIKCDWHCWLREFGYIATFPITLHVHKIFGILRDLHCLEALVVQFAPTKSNIIFSDTPLIGRHHVSDFGDFSKCYREALQFVREMSLSHRLKLFRSLDWQNYAGTIKPEVELYLQDWTFSGDNWRKPTREDETDVGAMSSFD